jgi:purine-binding chemotaxis protein CheW
MARAPAVEMKTADEMEHRHDQSQYLTFLVSGETYALGILGIKEILEYGVPTDVPMMPRFIRGVINLRGAVVPVVDLAARLGREQSGITKKTCIVIVETLVGEQSQVIGVVVDQVNEVLEILPAEIEPPPAFGASIRTDFIEGLGKINGRFVIILNVGRVLSADEMDALVQASSSAVAA